MANPTQQSIDEQLRLEYAPDEDRERFGGFLGNIMGTAPEQMQQSQPEEGEPVNPLIFAGGRFHPGIAERSAARQKEPLAANPTLLERAGNALSGPAPRGGMSMSVPEWMQPPANSGKMEGGEFIPDTANDVKRNAFAAQKAEAEAEIVKQKAEAEAARGAAGGTALANDVVEHQMQYEDEYTTAAKNMALETQLARDSMDLMQQENIQGYKNGMDRLKATYDKVDLDMAKLKIDPNNWEKETPAFTQTLMVLAAGAFGFITKGKTSNPILQILDRAIQKDVDVQMANYKMAMQKGGLQIRGVEQQEYAAQQMRTAMWSRAVHGLQAITENGKTQLDMINAHQLALTQLQSEHEKLYAKGGKAYTSQQPKEKYNPNDKMADVYNGMSALNEYITQFEATGSKLERVAGDMWGHIPYTRTNAKTLAERRRIVGALAAKASLPGQVSDKESATFADAWPGASDSTESAWTKFMLAANETERHTYEAWGRMSPQQREQNQQKFDETLSFIEGIRARNPALGSNRAPPTARGQADVNKRLGGF